MFDRIEKKRGDAGERRRVETHFLQGITAPFGS